MQNKPESSVCLTNEFSVFKVSEHKMMGNVVIHSLVLGCTEDS